MMWCPHARNIKINYPEEHVPSFLGPYFGTHLIQSKIRESWDRGHEQVYLLSQAYNEEPPIKILINLCDAHLL